MNYLVANPTLIDQIYEIANQEMIARLYRDLGRYSEAEPYFKRVLDAKRSQGDELETLKEVSHFYSLQNNYYEAQKYLLEAVTLQEKEILQGSEDRQLALRELADTYSELGEIYSNQNVELQAEYAFHLSQALQNAEIAKRRINSLQRSSANASKDEIRHWQKENAAHLEKCADLFLKLHRISAAESAYLLAFALRVLTNSQTPEDNDRLSAVQIKLGSFYRYHRKNYAEAEKRYHAAVSVLSNYRSTQSTLEGEAMTQMGSLYAHELKKPADGEKLLKMALESLASAPGSEEATSLTLGELATLYLNQSRFSEALDVSKRKVTVAHAFLKRTSPKATGSERWNAQDYSRAFSRFVWAVYNLGVAHRAAGDHEGAAAVANSLLDPDLRISEVLDVKVLTEYADMLVRHRQLLPPAAAENLEQHLDAIAVRRKYIEAILGNAD